ncbi:MAG: AI-2E family transporter [Deltaproteobacteria bacterium]|nr:MAG: AI-2E family transporter [Deltaproteobacteria bacterium]
MSDPVQWLKTRLSDPQILSLIGVGVLICVSIVLFGRALGPFWTALMLAYFMEGVIGYLGRRLRLGRRIAFLVVFGLFLCFLLFFFIGVLPTWLGQLTRLLREIPGIIHSVGALLDRLQEEHARFFSENPYLTALIERLTREIQGLLERFTSKALATTIPGVINLGTYLLLTPILIFFLLKDKDRLLAWLRKVAPQDRSSGLLMQILRDIDRQIGNLLRAKFIEVILVGGVTWVVFYWLGFNYALLAGVLTGLSTLIPFLGMMLVAFPIVFLGFFQWGAGMGLVKVMLAYAIIQVIDGNLLAPVLLGESVRIHPVGVIVSVLICGAMWGVIGVFLAVPIAIIVKSLIDIVLPYLRRNSQVLPEVRGGES